MRISYKVFSKIPGSSDGVVNNIISVITLQDKIPGRASVKFVCDLMQNVKGGTIKKKY